MTAATGVSAAVLGLSDRGIIAPNKLADLILVAGEPLRNIEDVEKIQRVFLAGTEIDREKIARDIASLRITPLEPRQMPSLLDDFEQENGRSNIDTLPINSTDAGLDHAAMILERILREPTPTVFSNHAMAMFATMSVKNFPAARIDLPLSKGAVLPADASKFQGVEFEARGDGQYRFVVPTRNVRNADFFAAEFQAKPVWETLRIPFSSLKQRLGNVAWSGDDLLMLRWEIARPPSSKSWLEIDNVKFY